MTRSRDFSHVSLFTLLRYARINHRPMGSTNGTLRILLVEDHRDTAEVVAKLLQYEGHLVDVAGTLNDALRRCRAGNYDVALCDIGLPDGSGLELARTLKHECPGTRFVALTAHGMPREVEQAVEAGFDAHLLKPVTADTLFAELHPPATHG